MTEDPGAVVRRLVEAFNAFDIDAVIGLCAPDVVVHENPAFWHAHVGDLEDLVVYPEHLSTGTGMRAHHGPTYRRIGFARVECSCSDALQFACRVTRCCRIRWHP